MREEKEMERDRRGGVGLAQSESSARGRNHHGDREAVRGGTTPGPRLELGGWWPLQS